MARSLGTLTLDLIAKTGGFEAGMDKAARVADQKTREIEKNSKERSKGVEEAFSGIAKALAPVMGGIGIAKFINDLRGISELADKMGKFAQKTGTSVESFSSLAYAAKLSDVTIEDFATSLEKLSKKLLEVKQGNIAAKAAFDSLKLDPSKFSSPDQAMLAIAGRFNQMQDGAVKTALAMEFFGKSGAGMIPLLNSGANEIARLQQEARQLGAVFSEETAKKAEEFNDNLTRLNVASQKLKIEIATNLLPGLTEVSKAMVQAAKDGGTLNAVWAALGGLGAFLFTDEFASNEKKLENLQNRLKNLKYELAEKQKGQGLLHDWIYGTGTEVTAEIAKTENQIKELKKLIQAGDKKPEAPKPTFEAKIKPTTKTPGENFIEHLKRQVEGVDKNQYAMLRLEAAQKGVAKAAEPYIKALQRADAAHAARADRDKAAAEDLQLWGELFKQDYISDPAAIKEWAEAQKRANDDLEFQISLIGKSAAATEILTQKHQILLDAENQIRAAERDGYPMSADNQKDFREAAQKAADDYVASRTRMREIDQSWQAGAQKAYQDYMANLEDMGAKSKALMSDAFSGMENSLVEFVKTGKFNFTSLADSIISNLARIAVQNSIMKPLLGYLGSIFPALFGGGSGGGAPAANAQGGIYSGPGINAYSGQIVARPTLFPFATGTGLMGEAGPEAILPLKRGTDGKLGVTLNGGGGATVVNVTVNQTGTTERGAASEANAREFSNRVKAAVQQVIVNEQRPGGLLYR